jgi:tetratricopeptide (TPR) repeat protein
MHSNYSATWEYLGEMDSSFSQIREAIRLEPDNPVPLLHLADRGLMHRRFDEAAEAADQVTATFPDNPSGYRVKLGILLFSSGNQEDARKVMAEALGRITQPPTDLYLLFPVVGGEYTAKFEQLRLASANAGSIVDTLDFYKAKAIWAHGRGRAERARATFDSLRLALESAPPGAAPDFLRLPNLAVAYAGLGRREDAEHAIRELLAFGQRSESQGERATAGGMAYQAAIAYMLLGKADAAVQQLERWLTLPTGGTPAFLRIDPTFAPLRGDASFRRLVGKP